MRARGAAAFRPGTGGSGVSGQRAHSPAPREPGRGSRWENGSDCASPAAASRLTIWGQFLNRENIHVMPPHNAKERRRVCRAALGVDGEQAQVDPCQRRS